MSRINIFFGNNVSNIVSICHAFLHRSQPTRLYFDPHSHVSLCHITSRNQKSLALQIWINISCLLSIRLKLTPNFPSSSAKEVKSNWLTVAHRSETGHKAELKSRHPISRNLLVNFLCIFFSFDKKRRKTVFIVTQHHNQWISQHRTWHMVKWMVQPQNCCLLNFYIIDSIIMMVMAIIGSMFVFTYLSISFQFLDKLN